MNILKNTKQTIAAAVLLVSAGMALAPTSHAAPAGAPAAVYANPSHGYAISYPTTWRKLPTQNFDVLLESPDHNVAVFVVSFASSGQVSAGFASKALGVFAKHLGTPVGSIRGGAITLPGGVHGRYAMETIQESDGTHGILLVVTGANHGQVAVAGGLIADASAPTFTQDTHDVVNVTASLAIR
jgi:hypothetical protein